MSRPNPSTWCTGPGLRKRATALLSRVFVLGLVGATLAGCGKKGPPQAPFGHRPGPVAGLSARQQGATLLLEATLPSVHTDGKPLEQTPAVRVIRVMRGAEPYTVQRFSPAEVGSGPGGRALFRIAIDDVFRDSAAEKVTLQLVLEPARGKPSIPVSEVDVVRAEAPAPPTGISVTSEEAGIRLRWEAVATTDEVLGYHVYRRVSPGGAWEGPLGQKGLPETSYFDRQVRFGQTYEYAVRSVTTAGAPTRESQAGNAVQVRRLDRFAPGAPSDVRAVASGDGIRVFWFPPDARDLAGFLLYRQGAGAAAELLIRLPDDATFHLDAKVEAGRSYSYTIVAFDGAEPANESSSSEPAVETAMEPQP